MTFDPTPIEEIVHKWPPELDHLSASSLKMAVRCPEQWRQRYLLNKKEPPALALMLGGADHKAIEKSMAQKIETHTDLPVGEVRSAFVEEIERRVDSVGGINEVVVKGADDKPSRIKVYDEERRHGQEVVAAYHTQVSPQFQPLTVEESFSIEVPGLPVKVIGYIDITAERVRPGQETLVPDEWQTDYMGQRVIDRKRRSNAKKKPEPDWVMQNEIYQIVKPVPFDYHISVATKTPYCILPEQAPDLRVPVAPLERSTLLLKQIAAEIGFLYMRFGPDHPWPTKGKLHPWACGYCGFRKDCWGWQ